MTMDNSNNQGAASQLVVGAIIFGTMFFGLFAMDNYSWGDPVFEFSNLQLAGIISAMIAGAGAMYYKQRDERQLVASFLKIEIVLFTGSIFIEGIKTIYLKKTVVKYVYYYGTPAIVAGFVYIISAIWLTWLLFKEIKKRSSL